MLPMHALGESRTIKGLELKQVCCSMFLFGMHSQFMIVTCEQAILKSGAAIVEIYNAMRQYFEPNDIEGFRLEIRYESRDGW